MMAGKGLLSKLLGPRAHNLQRICNQQCCYFLCINMLKLCTQISLDLRTFLSDAYKCDAEWKSRLNNPLLQKLRNGKIIYLLSHLPVCLSIFCFFLENFYGEILKKFQKEGKVSPIDVDLVRNLFKHTYLKK